MKKALTLLALALLGVEATTAQSVNTPRCGHDIIRESYFANHPDARASYEAAREASFAAMADEPQAKTTANGPIPVVFHVVLTASQLNTIGGTAGVMERADSSIAVLNRDYNRRNGDSTLIPAVFKPLYSNMDIQFGLARRNEQGQATTGVEIYTIPSSAGITAFSANPDANAHGSGFACSDAKYSTTQGGNGLSAWDQSKYLNIWICNINNPNGVLGIAISPNTSTLFGVPAAERGVVLNYGAFGKRRLATQYFISGIDQGRTLTHEIGHFFELEHIWGTSAAGTCADDDGINDTPPQFDENYNCPTGVIPNCTNSPGGEMYMNYMDYLDDACLVMFTNGQGVRMRQQLQFGGPSYGLTQNPTLTVPLDIDDVAAAIKLNLAPNPARGFATLSFDPKAGIGRAVLVDALGRSLRIFNSTSRSAGTISLDLSGVPAGLYTVRVETADGVAISQKLLVQP